jgi:hypothetical protein
LASSTSFKPLGIRAWRFQLMSRVRRAFFVLLRLIFAGLLEGTFEQPLRAAL